MQTEHAFRRKEGVTERAHEAEFEAGVDVERLSLMLSHQVVLDQIAVAVTLVGGRRERIDK